MIEQVVLLTHTSTPVEVRIAINEKDRSVTIIHDKASGTFMMDIDPYPMNGPLRTYVRDLCNGNRFQMMKVFYPINTHRGYWDKYWI